MLYNAAKIKILFETTKPFPQFNTFRMFFPNTDLTDSTDFILEHETHEIHETFLPSKAQAN